MSLRYGDAINRDRERAKNTQDALFAVTNNFKRGDFSAFTSVNGGGSWLELGSGLPTIPVRELEIQKREGDLVAATFGRSFYVVDDYTPLRELAAQSDEILASDGHIFEVKDGRCS